MKQRTPHDQLIAVVSSLEGNLSNYKDGIITDERFVERVNALIQDLKDVIPHTIDSEWQGAVPDTHLPKPARTGFEDDGPPTSEWPLRPRR